MNPGSPCRKGSRGASLRSPESGSPAEIGFGLRTDAGLDEVVTLSHRAYSRAIFGKGAIQAAKFLGGKSAGMYDMADVLA